MSFKKNVNVSGTEKNKNLKWKIPKCEMKIYAKEKLPSNLDLLATVT